MSDIFPRAGGRIKFQRSNSAKKVLRVLAAVVRIISSTALVLSTSEKGEVTVLTFKMTKWLF